MLKNKGADQLCSNCTADLRLCFRYTDSTISPLLIPKISRFYLSSLHRLVCVGHVQKPKLLVSYCERVTVLCPLIVDWLPAGLAQFAECLPIIDS